MKVSIIFFLVSAVFVSTVFARNWRQGDNGQVRWDYNCDFYGSDLYNKPSTGEQCGGFCIAESQCTHFTYYSGTCYLKRNVNGFRETSTNGPVCGFVINRSNQPKPWRRWIMY